MSMPCNTRNFAIAATATTFIANAMSANAEPAALYPKGSVVLTPFSVKEQLNAVQGSGTLDVTISTVKPSKKAMQYSNPSVSGDGMVVVNFLDTKVHEGGFYVLTPQKGGAMAGQEYGSNDFDRAIGINSHGDIAAVFAGGRYQGAMLRRNAINKSDYNVSDLGDNLPTGENSNKGGVVGTVKFKLGNVFETSAVHNGIVHQSSGRFSPGAPNDLHQVIATTGRDSGYQICEKYGQGGASVKCRDAGIDNFTQTSFPAGVINNQEVIGGYTTNGCVSTIACGFIADANKNVWLTEPSNTVLQALCGKNTVSLYNDVTAISNETKVKGRTEFKIAGNLQCDKNGDIVDYSWTFYQMTVKLPKAQAASLPQPMP